MLNSTNCGTMHAVDRRQFGSTDDVAIFIDDTLDSATVRCVSNSPSAVAILSPQRLPMQRRGHVDASDLDLVCNYAAGMSSSAKKKTRRTFAGDLTNNAALSLSFALKPDFSTPCTKKDRQIVHDAACATTPYGLGGIPHGFVPLADFERVDHERHRFQKMYEHQKTLYEDMTASQQETYQKLQDKIVEVVALSTRNEESKRFIRQLKREMLESRTRVLDLHNRQWEENRSERTSSTKLQTLLDAQEAQFASQLHQLEARMAGMEGLIRDLTALRGEGASIQVSQLDTLLKASYAKNAALFADLIRQGRQIDMLTERKNELDRSVEYLRREKREMEFAIAAERRMTNHQQERFSDQIGEQQRMIVELRQCLIRTMASGGDSDSSGGDDVEVCEEEEPRVVVPPRSGSHDAPVRRRSVETPPMALEEPMGEEPRDVLVGQGLLVALSESKCRWGPVPEPPSAPTSASTPTTNEHSIIRESRVHDPPMQPPPLRPVRRLRAVPPAAQEETPTDE